MNILPLLLVLAQQQSPLNGFDTYVAQAVKDWRVPGLAIVVVKDDSIAFIKGYGVRELGKPDPVTVHTRFGNMSTTKAFTAMLVAMLADSARLSFDDPVQKYEPDVQFADPYVTREITVRDLLTHRVGFADPDYLWGPSGVDFGTIKHRLRLVPAQTSFRSRFQYNNVTYALAGDVAARAAGTTWQSRLRSRIFGPPTASLTHPRFQAYGLGWLLQDYRGEFVALHTGSIEGRSAIVGLIPDRRLGVAIFTNLDHSELRHALLYTVFDRFIGPSTPVHDWSAEMRAVYKRIADSTRAVRQAEEGKRIAGTRPTLPLDRYTGTYADSLYGTATIGMSNGQLTFQAGNMKGQMEPWQYDIFRITWADPFWDPSYVSFVIDPDGTVGEVRDVDGEQHYRRVR